MNDEKEIKKGHKNKRKRIEMSEFFSIYYNV